MSEHTPGRLRAEFGDSGSVAFSNEIGAAVAEDCPHGDISKVLGRQNIRRLVACWNACDGLPTDLLEDDSIMKIEGLIRRERDELLEALKVIIELNVQHAIDQYGDALKAEQMACVRVARAAIAKATGGAA